MTHQRPQLLFNLELRGKSGRRARAYRTQQRPDVRAGHIAAAEWVRAKGARGLEVTSGSGGSDVHPGDSFDSCAPIE